MLTIKCAKCKSKIIKYKKIGTGRVLKCWKNKITREYDLKVENGKLKCENCKNVIGEIKPDYVKMTQDAFTYTGTKD